MTTLSKPKKGMMKFYLFIYLYYNKKYYNKNRSKLI